MLRSDQNRGFGEIYRAIQTKEGIDRLVILKTIKKKLIKTKKVQDNLKMNWENFHLFILILVK